MTPKLSTAQKEVIRKMRDGEFPIILLNSAFWGRGHGGKINKNTIYSLKKRGIINLHNKLTDLGRSIEL